MKRMWMTGAVMALAAAACAPDGDTAEDATTQAAADAAAPTVETADASAAGPMIKPWGYPLEYIDWSVDPGDDFFEFANGKWLQTAEISSDRSGTGFSIEMSDRNDVRFAEIVADAAASDAAPGSDRQKIRDLYASFMDEAAVEARGLEPVREILDRIAAAETHEDVARLFADPEVSVSGPFYANVSIDQKNPESYGVVAGHTGLSMPNRDYYLLEDERFVEARAAFTKHVARMFVLLEIEGGDEKAEALLDLETKIATRHWPLADRRDADRTYNPMSVADLGGFAPQYPWTAHLAAAGLDVDEIVIREKDAFPELAALFADTPVATWKDYLVYQHVNSLSRYLPAAVYAESFDFYGRTLSGQEDPRERDKRGIEVLNNVLNQTMGRVYVERYFPESAKAEMTDIFENIRAALARRIQDLDWMSEDTKAKALSKLAAMNAKIAYPSKWQDYSALEIRPDDLVGNLLRSRAYEHALDVDRLSKPVDKEEWFTGPQIINAFYSATRNEAFIPAGYLQPPLFDPNADPAINYGAIGSIVGHEIGHGFDDQGSKYAADGKLENWWTEADRAAFDAAGAALADQYSQYEPLPGLFVNGRQTLGENLGDLAGMLVTYDAYVTSLNGEEPPVLDGFTGAQRVFLGRAQARRYMRTDESMRQRVVAGVHSPMRWRVNGVIRNMDAWYDAFGVEADDALYLAPDERVRAW